MAKHNLFQVVLISYRRLPARERTLFWFIILVVSLFLFPALISVNRRAERARAEMYFLLPDTNIGIGQNFPLELRVRTNGKPINAVEGLIQFNPTYFTVSNMTTENSFCSFYLDNNFDNIKGEVHISCGLPNPGFQGDSVVVHLNMRAKIVGSSTIKVDPKTANIAANDSKGTNILDKAPSLNLTANQIF